ncbi:MAG: hypothetical protein IAE99_12430 [Rhodothermales bacterium]|nr:hypothetical protein [Rhodothermales bacterium]
MRLLVPLLLVLAVAACARKGPEQAAAGNVATAMDTSQATAANALLLRTYVFLCDGDFRVVVRAEDRKAYIYLPGTRRLIYAQQSDTLYRGQEGSLRLWLDSAAPPDSATATTPARARAVLVADGSEHPGCVNQPHEVPWANARISGVGFRAVGHAPTDWNLDLYGLDSLAVFVTDGGATRWRIPNPAYDLRAASQESYYRATADGQPFEVHLQGRGCTDAQTGLRFATTVAVTFRGQRYTGCGRELN